MRLTEYEGKELLRTVGIATPASILISSANTEVSLIYPVVVKSQVPVSDRKKEGGVVVVGEAGQLATVVTELFAHSIQDHLPEHLLVESFVQAKEEWYVSFSYSTDTRGPVLALSTTGGSGVSDAHIFPINILSGIDDEFVSTVCKKADVLERPELSTLIKTLWNLFIEQKLVLLEINPLFVQADGMFVAGDAKIITDDSLLPAKRPFHALGGDIAIIASGGGASMLNIDLLMRAGGTPANYVEYSGNPPASAVEELTLQVLATPGIKGAWVVGGTANFTDTYETLRGFLDGLRRISPKPTYPIVIRRDGPRREEARVMLETAAKDEEFNLVFFGPETSMADSAQELLKRIQNYVDTH